MSLENKSAVRRIYVEKKPRFAVRAKALMQELRGYLGIKSVKNVRILTRYDIEGISDSAFSEALCGVFAEPPVDTLYPEEFPLAANERSFSVEYLPGQFDQRADSAVQCVQFINEDENPIIRTATTYVIEGDITENEFSRIKTHCINPVDSRQADDAKPETLSVKYEKPADVAVFDGFTEMSKEELLKLYDSLNMAMTFDDFCCIAKYFKDEERRDPTVTEIRVLDTYWSDHCRHTTFATEITDVDFGDGDGAVPIKRAYERYMADHDDIFGKDAAKKPHSLMDVALMAMLRLKKDGKLTDMEDSDEINACNIVVPLKVDGKTEDWIISFKNETHNHPTEIEPFGGAATCLGGCIRDPLSSRTYVYQAMRVTGAADPTAPASATLSGKLPQKKLVREAARGYSSYGNQIGLSTGMVKEIYHPGYAAKRMEIGAVIGAAKKDAVRRKMPLPGDIVILLGGRTGRDGIGGATGSSKAHNLRSIETCGAEVQKGNPPTERKIQRLFAREEVSRLIRRCNDFGAGGVSVAIGELADGLVIDLDAVPKKYAGLDGTETAISESQERMAVVVSPDDEKTFLAYANEENLEAVAVARVTAEKRLIMLWRGKKIVDISRAFLDTNGARQKTKVFVKSPSLSDLPLKSEEKSGERIPGDAADIREKWLNTLSDLNVCSQKGLVEMFDGSIGACSVLMPHGGKYQLTETLAMVAKIPVRTGKCDAVTMMSFGFDPYLSSASPFHGASYAVLESVAKIVAEGGDPLKIRLTFQEYFGRMTKDPERWGVPLSALLGAYVAQLELGIPAIGGKDSMSGTFGDMDVPPTLVSFAVDVAKCGDIISPEFKEAGDAIVLLKIKKDSYELPDYAYAMDQYGKFKDDARAGRIRAAYALDGHGIAPAVSKMAFGNMTGAVIYEAGSDREGVDADALFAPAFGNIIAEVRKKDLGSLTFNHIVIGKVTSDGFLSFSLSGACKAKAAGDTKDTDDGRETAGKTPGPREDEAHAEHTVRIDIKEALEAWEKPLEKVFPTVSGEKASELQITEPSYHAPSVFVCRHKTARPTVFIPVFPGTNCEYDSAKAFSAAGAEVNTVVFKNLTPEDIRESVTRFEKAIDNAQIIMFPGGFSAGDEPDGSAKFFATAFRNERLKDAVERLLYERDGLALGICNGFQALIKLGLLPTGHITGQNENSPTLTYNTIGRHVSKMVYTKVVSDKSPWLSHASLDGVYTNPASHGEGRFVASPEVIRELFANGQAATRYCDPEGRVTMDEEWNPNGSYECIEGITSPDGRVFGKMAHCERMGDHVAMNIIGRQDMGLFAAGVEYFR